MQITDFNLIKNENLVRATALVTWEDCERPAQEVYIETEAQFGDDFTSNQHAFLVGCLLPAMHFGEKRISLEVEICPLLREGLDTVMALIHAWYGDGYKPLKIEPKTSSRVTRNDRPARAGLFLSGGFDSLAALRLNKLHYAPDHPGSVKDCFLIHGFDIGGVVKRGMKYHVFERAKAAMAPIAKAAKVELIPVYTNIRHLCDDRDLWLEKFFGAIMAAVAHTFVSRINLVYIASSYDIPNLVPCGSHPLIDPAYSSYDLRIIHRDVELPRMDKIRLIADWDIAFQNFRVCLANVTDRLNCGKCEKCVRTMTELAAIGALAKTKAFSEDDVKTDHFASFEINIRHREPFYEELLPLLEKQGRFDLVNIIKEKLST
ncbi:MAG: hypothetical protein H8D61_00825 [Deltaproteobacteria bacterium]|nr:hypothetical protein [Deltaproteobacteria bacterium]